MRIARNYMEGVRLDQTFGLTKGKGVKQPSEKEILEARICRSCPYSDCKKGVCDHFRQEKKKIMGAK